MKITNLNDFVEYTLLEVPEFYDLSLAEKIEEIEGLLDGLPTYELIAVYNEIAKNSYNTVIYDAYMINEILSSYSVEDVITMTVNGDVRLNHKYFIIDDLGHLYSGDSLGDFSLMDTHELANIIEEQYL